jgi:hypothetical protein
VSSQVPRSPHLFMDDGLRGSRGEQLSYRSRRGPEEQVAAQAAAALTPGHDDAMPGVGGDTLCDVHRSGVAEFGPQLGNSAS